MKIQPGAQPEVLAHLLSGVMAKAQMDSTSNRLFSDLSHLTPSQRHAISDRFRRAEIPERHMRAVTALRARSLAENPLSPWTETCQSVLQVVRWGGIVALLGPRGTGKTQLSACIAAELSITGTVCYRQLSEVYRELRSTYRRESDHSEFEVFQRYARFGLLILDEAHERGESEYERR